ncbi:hypothetical protein H312_01412 [Anncaliia algerae PRA339]|uniref:Uncharacterized protein n=1 Tax=Anncaliia algerae PRA339 TaxID=1288291 RepID=A0A059F265_9MICR|nr:hypothetical protein H312_01412 [Anncaliia algerae PRA339]
MICLFIFLSRIFSFEVSLNLESKDGYFTAIIIPQTRKIVREVEIMVESSMDLFESSTNIFKKSCQFVKEIENRQDKYASYKVIIPSNIPSNKYIVLVVYCGNQYVYAPPLYKNDDGEIVEVKNFNDKK